MKVSPMMHGPKLEMNQSKTFQLKIGNAFLLNFSQENFRNFANKKDFFHF